MRMRCLLLPALLLLAPAVSASDLHANPRHLQPRDVFDLEWADNPALSPDGRLIVYQRNHFDIMKDRRRSHLWLLATDGSLHRPLTSGQAGDGPAVWSPQGDRIAWVSSREGSAQVWMRWMDTGQSAVISQLTEAPGNLAWSPDGRWLAFTMRVPAEPRTLARLPRKPAGAEWAPEVKVIDRIGYRADGAGYLRPGYMHVFLLPAEGGTPRQVTRGEFQHRGAPAWSPDGRYLYVSSNYSGDWQYEPQESEIYRIDVATGEAVQLTRRQGPDRNPVVSPDGRRLAYLGHDDRKLGWHVTRLYVLDLDSGESRELTGDFDYSIDNMAWDRDGRGLFVGYERNGRGHIGWIPARGGKVEPLVDDVGGLSMGRPYTGGRFLAANGRVAYTRGTEYRPADVAVLERGRPARILTDLNADVLGHKVLGRVEEFWVKSSADGLDIQGWIVTPPDFDHAKKYPLLLEIHGGPHSAYGPHFAPETQLYASAGYVVLYVNPRGSTSYGQAFADHIHHNYPSQDYDDLMSSVDAVLARGRARSRRWRARSG